MNRRNFIKSLGAVAMSVPLAVEAEPYKAIAKKTAKEGSCHGRQGEVLVLGKNTPLWAEKGSEVIIPRSKLPNFNYMEKI